MSLNEANELKIIVETLCHMIDMLLVLGKECHCNQCIVSADSSRLVHWKQHLCSSKTFSEYLVFMSPYNLGIWIIAAEYVCGVKWDWTIRKTSSWLKCNRLICHPNVPSIINRGCCTVKGAHVLPFELTWTRPNHSIILGEGCRLT